MNAASLAAPLPRRGDTRPGLGRLTAVELRKMTDTRAGFWLQLAIVVLTVLVVAATCSVVLSLVALALCVVVAVVGTAVAAPGLEHTWSLPVALMGQHVVSLGTGMISGVALGAALLASAPAIVLSFVLPIGWAIVGRLAGLDAVARWLDGTYSLAPLTEHVMSSTEWARAGTTLALWMALPLLIGLWRITRGEIR